jgi:hypothetical protein
MVGMSIFDVTCACKHRGGGIFFGRIPKYCVYDEHMHSVKAGKRRLCGMRAKKYKKNGIRPETENIRIG